MEQDEEPLFRPQWRIDGFNQDPTRLEDDPQRINPLRRKGKLVCEGDLTGNRKLVRYERRLKQEDGGDKVFVFIMCEFCLAAAGIPPWANKPWGEAAKEAREESVEELLTRVEQEERMPRYQRDGERRPCRSCGHDVLMYMTSQDNPMYLHTAGISAEHLDRDQMWSFANAYRRVRPVGGRVDADATVLFPHWLVCPARVQYPPESWMLRTIWAHLGGVRPLTERPIDVFYSDGLLTRGEAGAADDGTATPLF